jgi:5-methylcytosine-specific restriction endonuclease McrA
VSRSLVLNASFEPLCIVNSRRALLLVLYEKAELIHATDAAFHSETHVWAEPSVVRLNYYVRVPFQAHMALNRRAIFARDNYKCQYCNAHAENIDHVVPRSRGGTHAWDNVVAACRRCNAAKRDHLLSETHLRLRHVPAAPRSRASILLLSGSVREEWREYLTASHNKLSA